MWGYNLELTHPGKVGRIALVAYTIKPIKVKVELVE